ncbi:hypothetical protein [Ammoniphilus sp. CFH 90114]|uniref:hypothetical protein n=1 Tax=Ammoniphilus sp. CFH 90114 TaxID=2493665 RepID=UPI00100DE74A|nr:hypothetical protein [Ammoniphilus sp. CFH 90114]RXT07136.1 hypothetical protein EIZ39_13390 [Ammoniphilus sp. CFH 90114]
MGQVRLSKDELEIKSQCNPLTQIEINIRGEVMSKINQEPSQSSFLLQKPAMAGIFALCLLIVGGIGTYATGVWQLTDSKGEIVYEAETLDKNSYIVKREGMNPLEQDPEITREWEQIHRELRDKMNAGQVMHVYVNDLSLNPIQTTTLLTKPVQYQDYGQWEKGLERKNFPSFMKPTLLPDGFTFHYGVAEFDIDTYYNMGKFEQEMKEEASRTGQRILIREGNYDETQPSYSSIMFTNGQEEIAVRVQFTGAKRLFVSPDAKVEKVSLPSGKEGFYVVDQGTQFIEWVKGEAPRTIYTIQAKADSKISKEDLMLVAENMK